MWESFINLSNSKKVGRLIPLISFSWRFQTLFLGGWSLVSCHEKIVHHQQMRFCQTPTSFLLSTNYCSFTYRTVVVMKLLKMYLILLMFDYNIPTRRKVERERAQTTELKKKKKTEGRGRWGDTD